MNSICSLALFLILFSEHAFSQYIGKDLELLVDPTSKINFPEILKYDFEKSKNDVPAWGYTSDTIWIKWRVERDDDLVEINNAALDNITVYYLNSSKSISTGDKKKFTDRPIAHRNFIFPIKKGEILLFKVNSSSSLKIPMRSWTYDHFVAHVSKEYMFAALFFGVLLAISFLSFVLFFAVDRQPIYFIHACYIIAFFLLHFSLDGFGYQFIWGDFPQLKKPLGIIFLAATNGLFVALNQHLASNYKFGGHAQFINYAGWLLIALGLLFFNYSSVLLCSFMWMLVTLFVLFFASCHSIHIRGSRYDKVFLLVNSVNIVSYTIYTAKSAGLISYGMLSEHITEFLYVFEFALITHSISSYYQDLKHQKSVFQAVASSVQMLCHDIRSPLNIAKTVAAKVRRNSDDREAILDRYMPHFDRTVFEAERMLNDLIKIDDIRLNKSKVALKPFLEKIASEMNLVFSNPVIEVIAHEQDTWNLDEWQIKRLLVNLLSNAFNAIRNHQGESKIWLKSQVFLRYVSFEVGNTGSKIPAENIGSVFNSFWTTSKKNGAGLGLAIAESIVKRHGGKIICVSNGVSSSGSKVATSLEEDHVIFSAHIL